MSVTRNVLWKRRSALFCFVLMGGFGAEEPIFPKAPKPFSEKESPRISATAFTGSAETCQQHFKRFTKMMRRVVRTAW